MFQPKVNGEQKINYTHTYTYMGVHEVRLDPEMSWRKRLYENIITS